MLEISKKNSAQDVAVWSKEPDILAFLQHCRPSREQKDFYMFFIIEKLLTRIETLEECVDELLAEEK